MSVLAIGAVALAIRLGFVLWAPGQFSGDALFYHANALALMKTGTYVWFDGSPAVQWMPGWPMTLAGLYTVFGVHPKVGMVANAVFGAATAGALVVLGGLLFDRRAGRIAGLVYAMWPANVCFVATLFTEPAFNFLLVAWMTLLAAGARGVGGRRTPWFVAAGLTLGLGAMVKAEPLVLVPAEILFLWSTRRSARDFGRVAAAALLATAGVVAPWTYRNHVLFGRVMVTSASGGMVAWLGAHALPEDGFREAISYMARHERGSYASTVFAASEDGWRDAWRFARSQPAAWWAIQRAKLAATYGSDDEGANLVRGDRPSRPFIGPAAYAILVRVSDGFWWSILALAGCGLFTLSSWWPPARVLVLGIPLTWLVTHVLMVAGPRFHAPETLSLALLAARALGQAIEWVRDGLDASRAEAI